jgi:hypothetical protein
MNEPIFDYTGHKKLWNWLANHPGKDKDDYFKSHHIIIPEEECYACEYDKQYCEYDKQYNERCNSYNNRCTHCPLNTSHLEDYRYNRYNCNSCLGGMHSDWEDWCEWSKNTGDHNYTIACSIAKQIANLPVRGGVKCK